MVENLLSNAGGVGSIPDLGTKIPRVVGELSPRTTTREKPACHNKEPALLRQPKINKETNNKHLNIKRSLCRESETEWPLVIRGQSRGLCLAANDRKTPPNVVCISPLKVNSGEKGVGADTGPGSGGIYDLVIPHHLLRSFLTSGRTAAFRKQQVHFFSVLFKKLI